MLREYERWLRYERDLAESTIKGYVAVLRKLFRELGEPRKTSDAKLEQIRDYLQGTSRSHRVNVLTAWQHWCEFLGRPRKIKKPSFRQGKPSYLTRAEVGKLLEVTRTTRERAVLLFLLTTGVRVSELVGLDRDDVLWDELVVHVRSGKRRQSRYVAIAQEGLEELEIYLEFRDDDHPALIASPRGGRWSRSGVYHMVKRLAHRSGLKKRISPHIFRHSCATLMLEGGADLAYIQRQLGHSRISTTEIYLHTTTRGLTSAYQRAMPKLLH